MLKLGKYKVFIYVSIFPSISNQLTTFLSFYLTCRWKDISNELNLIQRHLYERRTTLNLPSYSSLCSYNHNTQYPHILLPPSHYIYDIYKRECDLQSKNSIQLDGNTKCSTCQHPILYHMDHPCTPCIHLHINHSIWIFMHFFHAPVHI